MTTAALRIPTPARPAPKLLPPPPTAGTRYRERDFGIGYGRSSGYASPRHYVTAWNGQPRFRCG